MSQQRANSGNGLTKGKNSQGKIPKTSQKKAIFREDFEDIQNTVEPSKSDIFYLLRDPLKCLLRTFFSSAEFSEVFALRVFTLLALSENWVHCKIDTEYDRAKVPPYNGNDPLPAPGSLKALLLPALLDKVQNKGTQGLQARYGAELPPFISIVRCPGRPVILGMDKRRGSENQTVLQGVPFTGCKL